MMMGNGFGFGIPGLGMLIIWGGIIFLVIWLVRGISRQSRDTPTRSAIDVLNERYARGEIDREEYEEKKRSITNV